MYGIIVEDYKMASEDKGGNILAFGEFEICNIPDKCSGSKCNKLCIINQIVS